MNAGGHTSLIPKSKEGSKREHRTLRRKRQGNRPGPHRTQDSHARNAVQGPGSLWPGKLGTCGPGGVSEAGRGGRKCGGGAGHGYGKGGREGKIEGRPGERGPGRHRNGGQRGRLGARGGEGEGEGEGEGGEGTGTEGGAKGETRERRRAERTWLGGGKDVVDGGGLPWRDRVEQALRSGESQGSGPW